MADRHGASTARSLKAWLGPIAAFMVGVLPLVAPVPARAAGGQANAAGQANTDLIARGKYLSDAGDCMACHTNPGGTPFAGGLYLATPFGPISTPNITPDKATGIGTWTDDQFYRALHAGVRKDGAYLYPAMPYPWYTKVTRDDVMAIKTYLFSLPPANAPRKQNKLAFPFDIRTGLLAWNEAFFHEGIFKPDPKESAAINRGAYLVQGLGHCGECHNGHALLGTGSVAEPLQGGSIQNWYAPNLTSDVQEGIGKYSDDQVVSYLKTGQAQGMGVAAGPMAETIHDSLSKLNDADLHAIVAFLKSTPAKASYASDQRSDYKGPQPAGRQVYLNDCVSCHQQDGRGMKGAVASLVGNGAVLARGSQDVIRVILGGIVATGNNAPMPAIGVGMTDQQVAEVTNYVRQSWGNKAPPNAGGGMVGTLRAKTPPVLYGPPAGPCPKIARPDIAAAVADPKTGIDTALKAMTQATVLQTADAVLPKIKAAAPKASRADLVNGLAQAYCPIVRQDARVPAGLKAVRLDEFSERVYSELAGNGQE